MRHRNPPSASLPGFVASSGVSCVTSGTAVSFSVSAVGITTGYVCTWASAVPPTTDHLVCS